MASPQKILSALHANWWLNVAGLLLSFAASVVLVRTMPAALYAEYGAVLAIVGVATLVFEAGANSGLTRYLTEAAGPGARGTFYLRMQRRRWLAAALCAVVLIAAGPFYARGMENSSLAAQPWSFVLVAAVVAGTLTRLLAHYGLVALFETKSALLLQQGFVVLRAVAVAAVALAGGGLLSLLVGMLLLTAIEALVVHRRLWGLIGTERAAVSTAFVNRAQSFGLLTIFDKACAMLGSGTVLLLVLAPQHPAATVAFLVLAVDLVGKLVSLTVMPMGNLVAPYLSQTGDDAQAQGTAVARVVKLSSLLYCFCIGLGILLLPWFVPVIYGEAYAHAATLALLLLVPMAFENWVRGCCSPALLRNGRYRELARVNILQAAATITTIALVHREPVETVLLAVGSVRAAIASLNLLLLRKLVPARTGLVPMQAALVAALSLGGAWACGVFLPLPQPAAVVLAALVFTGLFSAGMRCLVFRDEDTLRLAHRIAGRSSRFFTWLLPRQPLTHA